MNILAIDPGTHKSGWVHYAKGRVIGSGTADNASVVRMIVGSGADRLAIEKFEARGMAMGQESIDTMIWAGRFQQAWNSPEYVHMVYRRTVKQHICGSAQASDSNIRMALIDIVGPPGKKAAPGPTYGVISHAWAALAVAVTVADSLEKL